MSKEVCLIWGATEISWGALDVLWSECLKVDDGYNIAVPEVPSIKTESFKNIGLVLTFNGDIIKQKKVKKCGYKCSLVGSVKITDRQTLIKEVKIS